MNCLCDYSLLLQPDSPLETTADLNGLIECRGVSGGDLYGGCAPGSGTSNGPVREHPMECVRIRPHGDWKYLVATEPTAYGRQEFPLTSTSKMVPRLPEPLFFRTVAGKF